MIKIKTESGLEIDALEGNTILNCALSAGLVFEYSCKSGQCGVCVVTLVKGEVSELSPQLALSNLDRKNNLILTCCCTAKTSILIDAEDLAPLHGIDEKILPARINSLELLSEEIIEVKLRVPPTSLFNFLEGQHINVIGLNSITRSYSIASISLEKEISLLIKRVENGALSEYWFEKAKVNDLLRIEGPKGTFYLRDPSKEIIFLATGTGIAPILSILRSLDMDKDFIQKKDISLYWGNRTSSDLVWEPEFSTLKINYNPVLSRPNCGWQGKVGYIQQFALQENKDLSGVNVYACGSSEMIVASKNIFINAGLSENNFYSDAFVSS